MNKIVYNSVFSPFFYGFVASRQNLGYVIEGTQYILKEFDQFFITARETTAFIRKEHIDEWRITRTNDQSSTLARKYNVWIQFGKYMQQMVHEGYIPRMPRFKKSNFVPHIFSHEEVSAIFNACDEMQLKRQHRSSMLMAMPALLRLLYSTGLRINEALFIKNRDVDFDRHIITINKTKNNCQRLASINPSMEIVLKQYMHYRNEISISNVADPDMPLFIKLNGKPCDRVTALRLFHKLLPDAGILYKGNHLGPRIHDLRFTSASHSLIKLSKEGLDPYNSLPLISTFLGHRDITSTEHYVRLTQEIYPDIFKLEDDIISKIYSPLARININENSHENGFC